MTNSNLPNIGAAIRRIRLSRNFSLEETALLTGVSKAMLGQIERGESSPTISTLWKISTGLKISFSSLINQPAGDYNPVSLEDISPVREAAGSMKLYNLFPFDPAVGFEYFYIELEPGCDYTSPSHANVVEEYVIVTEGRLDLTIGERIFVLNKGGSIRFKGQLSHGYRNSTGAKTVFQNIIKY